MDEGAPIAYPLLEKGVPVVCMNGTQVGTVDHVVAAPEEDIFHGLVIHCESHGKRFVPAEDVASLHEHGVELRIDVQAVASLPEPGGGAPTFVEETRGVTADRPVEPRPRPARPVPPRPGSPPPSSNRSRCHNRTVSTLIPHGTVAACFAERVREQEERLLSPHATRSYPARRLREEPGCSLRTPFQRDRDRIVHSKAFRRLTHKTQVFVAPLGDHYRTRLTHTLEVTTISRTVARALRLNEDLVEAIGLGHDLGHAPFGHIGEEALDDCMKARFGRDFRHYEHSLRIVDRLERDGAGLNLTEQVREGIARHSSRTEPPATLEGRIVRMIDRVAYINHDIDDAVRAGLLRESDLPTEPIAVLGETGSARIDALVHDMVEHSERAGEIVQGPLAGPAMDELRDFMFERVYLGPAVRAERAKIAEVIARLFEHYVDHPELLPPTGEGAGINEGPRETAGEGTSDGINEGPRETAGEGTSGADEGTRAVDDSRDTAGATAGDGLAERVGDYLAGMTDRYCIREYTELQVPRAFAR